MAEEVQQVRVFIASPSDVRQLRQIAFDVIDDVNQLLEGDRVIAKRVAWEDLSPGVGEDSQDVINQQVKDDYDIFVGILWHRFGTPTNRAESGTEEEVNRALAIYDRQPKKIKILTYKCMTGPSSLQYVDPTQLHSLNEFLKRLTVAGVLYYEFTEDKVFERHLRKDLIGALKTFGKEWGGQKRRPRRRLTGRLLELHDAIGGPFRTSPVLRSLRKELEAIGVECLERLLTTSRMELVDAGIDEIAIGKIEAELAKRGHFLRLAGTPVDLLDQLALTPGCRNAVRQVGIKNPTELTSCSWNDLMRSGHFVEAWVEEISLRLREEGLDLRDSDEPPLEYSDVLAKR